MIPGVTITEEALDTARQGFIASVQALDRRVSEEPLSVREQMFRKMREIRAGPHTIRTVH